MRRTGILTTDADLVIRSWDAVLESMTGVPAAEAIGRPLVDVAPDVDERGLTRVLRETLLSGSGTVLATAIHHYLIPCDPSSPSTEFTRMQQRVVVTPLTNEVATVGLAISIEDVTARLEGERQLARALRSSDPAVRKAAVEQFTANNGDDVSPVSAAIADDDWQVRRAAVGALASRADGELLRSIVTALRDGHHDFSLLSSAMRLLELTGMNAADALIELLHSDEIDVRIQAALALGLQSGPAVVHALLGALDDPDRNVRFHVIESLGKLRSPETVAPLAQLAAHADFFLAFPAIEALVRIGDPSAAAAIVSRLDDPELRDAAADALGALGDEDVVAPLVERLEQHRTPVGPIVCALATIHARYDETAGAGGRIEDLTRRLLGPRGASAILEFVPVATGPDLRAALLVLSWTRTASIAASLAQLLADAAVPHDVIETLVRFGSPILEVLVAQLQRGAVESRRAAAVSLGRLGDRRAVPALLDALAEGDAQLIPPVANALARLGDHRAFEPLVELLGHADPGVRQAVVGALNSIGHPAMAARTAQLLEADDPNVRQSAAKIAGYFGYPECADALLARGRDPDERVRAVALEHVAYLEHAGVVPLLRTALRDDTPRCRAAAAAALGHVDDASTVDDLLAALKDGDAWVRYFAALSLGRRRHTQAAGALAALAGGDPAGHVRIAAIDALGLIGGPRALAVLEPLTASQDSDVAAAALRAMGEVHLPGVAAILQAALRSEDPRRRAAAANGLAAYGGRDAIDALRWTASADQDATVVASALAGLAGLAARRGDAIADAVHALATVAADPARRMHALPVLTKIPPTAVPALDSALRSDDAAVRAVTVDALARIARPPASSLLMQALDDPDAVVRARAVEALSRLGTRGVTRRLASLARDDQSEDVRRLAEVALARAGGADAERQP